MIFRFQTWGPIFQICCPLLLPPSQKIMPVRGGLKAAVNLAGPFTRPAGSLKLQTRQIRVAGTPLGDADIDLKFSEDKLQILSAVCATAMTAWI